MKNEMQTNEVHLLRLCWDLSRNLTFDVGNDNAIPVVFPDG